MLAEFEACSEDESIEESTNVSRGKVARKGGTPVKLPTLTRRAEAAAASDQESDDPSEPGTPKSSRTSKTRRTSTASRQRSNDQRDEEDCFLNTVHTN